MKSYEAKLYVMANDIISISDFTTGESGSSYSYSFENYEDFKNSINEYNNYLKENFELVYLDSEGNRVEKYTNGGYSFYYNSEDNKMLDSDMSDFTYTITIGTWNK